MMASLASIAKHATRVKRALVLMSWIQLPLVSGSFLLHEALGIENVCLYGASLAESLESSIDGGGGGGTPRGIVSTRRLHVCVLCCVCTTSVEPRCMLRAVDQSALLNTDSMSAKVPL